MTNNANPAVPAQRYFTLDEMCALLQISPAQFARWQQEHGIVIGYGGDRYTRADVVKLLKLKDTFLPYTDSFSQGLQAADGQPAADAEEIRVGLKNVLADLENALSH
ncbi:DNA-binding protein [Bergeriella denitrificans]|uniref:Uncharacterized protein n=1 Tax=Bergeriella denitrificans TaxID=494 RepID=A0A378UFL8_BERDE|nr:DNA-binding protein [Bergeriella denitrificans]STZ76198.1 Uncharacterised protein [Bergeriella denitrificans]